ncbi:auxin-induced protein 22D [Salvia hispanica]|uniref:auxin-induced protein 22D n=1 Tax=Salvia hispanica TaxID=49212 RepID=UPI002009AF68|nr:auxin-induced protein 22D [Salvia hispanica]
MPADLNLRLGLPGSDQSDADAAKSNKRSSPETAEDTASNGVPAAKSADDHETAPAPKAQIVGWPPVKSYRKSTVAAAKKAETESGMYVKVSMDGAPYLRKIDIKLYNGYSHLLTALEDMFKLSIGEYSEREGYKGSEYAPAYEDKDGDLMLVGDVPWEMFMSSCKRLRIMRGADARGLGCAQ